MNLIITNSYSFFYLLIFFIYRDIIPLNTISGGAFAMSFFGYSLHF